MNAYLSEKSILRLLDLDFAALNITPAAMRRAFAGITNFRTAGYAYAVSDPGYEDWLAIAGSPMIVKIKNRPGLKEELITQINMLSFGKIVLFPHYLSYKLSTGNHPVHLELLMNALDILSVDHLRVVEFGMKTP